MRRETACAVGAHFIQNESAMLAACGVATHAVAVDTAWETTNTIAAEQQEPGAGSTEAASAGGSSGDAAASSASVHGAPAAATHKNRAESTTPVVSRHSRPGYEYQISPGPQTTISIADKP